MYIVSSQSKMFINHSALILAVSLTVSTLITKKMNGSMNGLFINNHVNVCIIKYSSSTLSHKKHGKVPHHRHSQSSSITELELSF